MPLPRSSRAPGLRLLALGMSLSFLFLSGCATPPPPPPPKKSLPYKGIQKVYPSGLRLVAHELPDAAKMAMTVSIAVGTADEPEDKPGLAFLAAMVTYFSRPGGPTAPSRTERLAALGAAPMPELGFDGTDFRFTVPVARFSELAVQGAEWLRDPLANISEEDFLRVRELVSSGLRQTQAELERTEARISPTEVQRVIETVLPGHPYARPAFGTPETLQRLTLKDVREFVAQYYTPERALVTTIGPMPLEDVTFLVARSFHRVILTSREEPTPPWRRTPPSMPAQPPQFRAPVRKPGLTKRPHLWLVWTVPGLASGNRLQSVYALGVLKNAITARVDKIVGWEPNRPVETRFLERDGLSLIMVMVELKEESEATFVAERAMAGIDLLPSLTLSERKKDVVRTMVTDEYSMDLKRLPTGDVAHMLRATGRWDYLRVHQELLEETLRDDSMSSYIARYLQPEKAWRVLVVPET